MLNLSLKEIRIGELVIKMYFLGDKSLYLKSSIVSLVLVVYTEGAEEFHSYILIKLP